jgi:hypothetical protein
MLHAKVSRFDGIYHMPLKFGDPEFTGSRDREQPHCGET